MPRSRFSPHRRTSRAFATVCLLVLAISPVAVSRAVPPTGYELADLQALERTFTELADKVRPSVVAIRCYQVHSNEETGDAKVKLPVSQGSGFVLDALGHIGTNNHVVEDADLISVVLFNGLQFDARLVQRDERSDLAVIRIEAEDLSPVVLGDLAQVRVNQWAFACGNPFGLAYDNQGRSSVTYGVISAMGRQMTHRLTGNSNLHYYGNLLETSAAINPGNSGGPLFNIQGQVIGVVTAIETSSGVNEGHGFAIPVDRNIKRILDTLKSGAMVRYGFMGIQVVDVEPPTSKRVSDGAMARGARVSMISPPDGPAAKAGLQPRDVIVEFDGLPVESSDHLVRLVQYTGVGAQIEVSYLRQQVKRKTFVTLGDRNELLGAFARGQE